MPLVNKPPLYRGCTEYELHAAPPRASRRKLRRKTGHRIAGGAVFSIVMIEVAHMAQHAMEGNYVAAVAVAASWLKDGVVVFLERYVEEEEKL